MFQNYWERTQCESGREWMEAGFDNRIWLDNKAYHWKCYWQIEWPRKARLQQQMHRQKVAVK